MQASSLRGGMMQLNRHYFAGLGGASWGGGMKEIVRGIT
jgi:hypothetical protein